MHATYVSTGILVAVCKYWILYFLISEPSRSHCCALDNMSQAKVTTVLLFLLSMTPGSLSNADTGITKLLPEGDFGDCEGQVMKDIPRCSGF
jgi:hypothetical protein